MGAELVDGSLGEDKVVGVGERVGVAGAAYEAFGESEAPGELAQVSGAAELEDERAVVRRCELAVEAGGEGVRAQRRADCSDKGREFGGAVGRGRGAFGGAAVEWRWARERERRVLFEGDERACVPAKTTNFRNQFSTTYANVSCKKVGICPAYNSSKAADFLQLTRMC